MVRRSCYICGKPVIKYEGRLVTEEKGWNKGCYYKAPVEEQCYWSHKTMRFETRLLCWRCAKNSIELLKEVTR